MKSTIIIEHGKHTCAIVPGKFCQFFGTMQFGQKAVCMLFDNVPLYEDKGWTQRCSACIEKFGTDDSGT